MTFKFKSLSVGDGVSIVAVNVDVNVSLPDSNPTKTDRCPPRR